MSNISSNIGKFGPLSVSLINSDSFNFYRFFYKRNNDNDLYSDTYTITLSNIVMKRLNLNDKQFRNYNSIVNFLSNISLSNSSVTDSDVSSLRNNIRDNFTNSNYLCLEVILPVIENNKYVQTDIDTIYNTIMESI